MNIKRTSYKVHSFLGVYLIIFLVLQILSGIAISYRWEFSDMIYGSAPAFGKNAAPLSIGTLVERFTEDNPDVKMSRVFPARGDDGPVLIQAVNKSGKQFFALNSYTGETVVGGGWLKFPFEAALSLHFQPLSGLAGSLIVVLNGLLLLLMAISGLIYAWPRPGGWGAIFQIKWQSGFNIWGRRLHKMLGLAAFPMVILIASTGLILITEILLDTVAASHKITQTPVKAEISQALNAQQIDQVAAVAQAEFPTGLLRDLQFNNNQIVVQSIASWTDPWAINRVSVGINPPVVMSVLSAQNQTAWWAAILPWHTGTGLGWFGRVMIVLCGITLIMMAVLGILLWWRSPARKKKRR